MWHLAHGQSSSAKCDRTWEADLNKGLCIHPEILSLVWGAAEEGGSEPLVEAAWKGMGMGRVPEESLFWPWFRTQ